MATHSSILAWRMPMDGRARWSTVRRLEKGWTRLKWLSFPQLWIQKSTVCEKEPVQFSRSVVSDSLQPHEPQHARPPWHENPCPSVMPSNHLILCHPFVLPPSIFPSIRVFSNESALRIRWPEYWSFRDGAWASHIAGIVLPIWAAREAPLEVIPEAFVLKSVTNKNKDNWREAKFPPCQILQKISLMINKSWTIRETERWWLAGLGEQSRSRAPSGGVCFAWHPPKPQV